jgi:hypothetical protein
MESAAARQRRLAISGQVVRRSSWRLADPGERVAHGAYAVRLARDVDVHPLQQRPEPRLVPEWLEERIQRQDPPVVPASLVASGQPIERSRGVSPDRVDRGGLEVAVGVVVAGGEVAPVGLERRVPRRVSARAFAAPVPSEAHHGAERLGE